jgi:hypothetical protein
MIKYIMMLMLLNKKEIIKNLFISNDINKLIENNKKYEELKLDDEIESIKENKNEFYKTLNIINEIYYTSYLKSNNLKYIIINYTKDNYIMITLIKDKFYQINVSLDKIIKNQIILN